MQSVFVSIIDFNGRENTIDCLNSIAKVNKDEFELNVLVINNSPKEKLNLPSFPNLKIKIIENKKNLGFAGGHNVGIKYALENGADFVLVLNNDTAVDKNLIVELVKAANLGSGITTPKIYFSKDLNSIKTDTRERNWEKFYGL